MSEKSFSSELSRALARPDVDQLKSVVRTYNEWNARNGTEKDWPDELDIWFDTEIDPDRGLALVMLAAATYDEPEFLAAVACGLLEELLARSRRPSEDFLRRVLDEARKTERFRWMLSGPYRSGTISDQAAAIKRAIGSITLDDPLPPRPWA